MYLEGNIISFTELGDEYKGIILEKRKDSSSLMVLDIYGSIKNIYRKDVISTNAEISMDTINTLLHYYKLHLDEKREEEAIKQYKIELGEIYKKYDNKIIERNKKIKHIKKSKENIIANLDIYTYQKLHERLNELLDNKAIGYEIFTDFTHSIIHVVFNRLYTLAEEGTFDINNLDFIKYYDDGTSYTEEVECWSEKAKHQANSFIKEIDAKLNIDKTILIKNNLEIEDRIIYGGALKDLTLERNYKFIPKNKTNKKVDIDEIFIDIGNFVKKHLIETEEEILFPWRTQNRNKKVVNLSYWRNNNI